MRVDVLEFLKEIPSKKAQLEAIRRSQEEIRLALIPGGIRYDIDKVQTSPRDRMPDMMARLNELQIKEEGCKAALLSDIDKAIHLINCVPTAEYRLLLRLRYINSWPRAMTWEKVADQMGYSVDHVKGYMHGRAVMEAREVWETLEG